MKLVDQLRQLEAKQRLADAEYAKRKPTSAEEQQRVFTLWHGAYVQRTNHTNIYVYDFPDLHAAFDAGVKWGAEREKECAKQIERAKREADFRKRVRCTTS